MGFLNNNIMEYKGTETNFKWTHDLIQGQKYLGKDKLWIRFITQKWGDIQETYHHREKHNQGYMGKSWATKVLQSIWALSLGLWKKRTQAVHKGKDTPHQQDLGSTITVLYDNIRKIPNIISKLFKHDKATLLKKNLLNIS